MCLRDGLGHFNLYQEREQLKTQLGEKTDACERLSQERDNMQGERDYANDSRDTFKEKYGQAQTAYEKSDAQVKAYQQQGIWGRVFGLKPKSMCSYETKASKGWQHRKLRSRGFICTCYYCLRKVERKRAGAMKKKNLWNQQRAIITKLERSVLRDSTPRHARASGFGSDMRQDACAKDNVERR